MRLSQYYGTKSFGSISEGRRTEISDGESQRLAWSVVYEQSDIDDSADGDEQVRCTFKRDSRIA